MYSPSVSFPRSRTKRYEGAQLLRLGPPFK